MDTASCEHFELTFEFKLFAISSLKMAKFISLISSRNVSMEVREFRVSSVLEFSLHCSISSSILEAFCT